MARRKHSGVGRYYNHNINGTEGNDHLSTNHDKDTVQAKGGDDTIDNGSDLTHIHADTGNDIVNSNGSYVRIYGEDGNDSISSSGDYYGEIRAGNGNDSITFNKGADAQIHGDAGDDYISNLGYQSKIYGGAGNDFIEMSSFRSMIYGENGNDTIVNRPYSAYATLNGGSGDDLISLASDVENDLIQYKSGDGNDTIQGFNSTSTLEISDALHSTETVGNDIIVTVGEGKITLEDAASLSSANIISSTYAIFTIKDSKVTAAIPQSVEGDAYQFNAELNLLTLNDNLKECPVVVRNEDNSSVKVSGSFGSAELSGNGTLEYEVDGAKNNVTLTSKTYGDKITFREDAAFTYGEIQVDLVKGGVVSTKGDKEISFDNNSSASVTAPEGAKINFDASKLTVNNLPITSTNGAGTISVTADGMSFEGYGVQFVDLEVDMESYFGKLEPATVNLNSADKSYTIKNAAQVETLSDDFTKLTLALGDDTQACFKVNGKEFLVANGADNLNVIEAKGNTFKIQGKEIDAEKIGRVTIGEQLTFSGMEINFDGVKVNYAHNKPAIYSLNGKEISISDAATVTTSSKTKTFKCEAGTYVVNGKSFETSTDLTFTADTNEIKLPLNDAATEIYFDGVTIGTRNEELGTSSQFLTTSSYTGGELVFDLANDKISIPSGATLKVTSADALKLNLAAGNFTINGNEISSVTELEITADKDSIQVPLENVVTIDEAKIIGTGAATIDNTDEYLYSILLPNGALVQNASDNTFELHGKDSFAYFGDTNKKVELTEDGTAYIAYDKENSIYVGLNALTFEQVEIQGNDAWTIETSGTGGIDKITGIKSGATITTSTEYVDAGDLRFEVETDGAGDFNICGEKFTSTDDAKNIYVVSGNSNDEIKVSPLADEFKDDDSEPAGKIYEYDAAGDYTVNGVTFHAEKGTKVQTITRGVEFDLSSGAFQYDGLTLDA